jgi:hypothetical protein
MLQVDVKDTVGCGDSFAAAIVLGYTRTHDVHATLLLANAVGAATAMGRGAGTNVADAKTVHELLQQAAVACNGNGAQRHDLEKAMRILHDSLSSAELLHLINTASSSSSSNGSSSRQRKTPAAHAA